MDTSIGNAKLLLTALNIQPPTKNNMQRHSNTVSEKINELNQKDMSEKWKLAEAHNIHLGKTGNPKEINFSLTEATTVEALAQHRNQDRVRVKIIQWLLKILLSSSIS